MLNFEFCKLLYGVNLQVGDQESQEDTDNFVGLKTSGLLWRGLNWFEIINKELITSLRYFLITLVFY